MTPEPTTHHPHQPSDQAPTGQDYGHLDVRAGHGPGVFIPTHVLVAVLCITAGALTGLGISLFPSIWLLMDATLTVAGLLLALYALWRGRHRTPGGTQNPGPDTTL